MRTREEVARYINSGDNVKNASLQNSMTGWHYGKVELRDLMDYIYGGKPTNEDQLIKRLHGYD